MGDQEKLLDEEGLYAQALAELKAGNPRPGLWAKAFAESAGDESKSQALYIKLRVQLEKERKQQEREAASAEAIESERRKAADFFAVIEQLRINGYEAKKSGNGWTVREPLGGRVKLNSDQALLAYAEGRVPKTTPKSAAPQNFESMSRTDSDLLESLRKAMPVAAPLLPSSYIPVAAPSIAPPGSSSSDTKSHPQKNTPAVDAPKKSSRWDWIWPSITAVIIVKLFGLVGGLVTIGAYYWLKPKFGIWGAVAASGALGVLVAIALLAMLRA